MKSSTFFRDSPLPSFEINFVVVNGGIGDFIGYLGCLEWIAKNQPQVIAKVFTASFMVDLATNIFKPYSSWKVFDREFLGKSVIEGTPTFAPFVQPINGMGAHHLELGFIYYTNTSPAPKDAYYPTINLGEVSYDPIPEPYVVLTPGACSIPRDMPPKAFNGIVDYLLEREITPVFLGKVQMTLKRRVEFNPDYDLSRGVNLIDRTSLLESALIMSKAKAVIGLDNGLLHLAGCVDVPVVFGYTIASPEHRRPRRPPHFKSQIIDVHADPKNLTCIFCQSRMRLIGAHDFEYCLYDDLECLRFLEDPKVWCDALNKAMT